MTISQKYWIIEQFWVKIQNQQTWLSHLAPFHWLEFFLPNIIKKNFKMLTLDK